MVNVLDWRVNKLQVPLGSDGSQLETHLSLTTWVRNIQYQKNVWIDFHVFDEADRLVHSRIENAHKRLERVQIER